jgi:hypothetical protein
MVRDRGRLSLSRSQRPDDLTAWIWLGGVTQGTKCDLLNYAGGCADGERTMSAKEYREYADECMRSAKSSTLVKDCRELLQKAETWLQAADALEAVPPPKTAHNSLVRP